MTDIEQQLAEIEAYCQKASEGPWQHVIITNEGDKDWESAEEISQYVLRCLKNGANLDFYAVQCVKPDGGADVCHVGNGPTSPANTYFIARARTDLPALCKLVRELLQREQWIPVSTPPKEEGRYAVMYRYKNLPPRLFTGDYSPEYGWNALPEDHKITHWRKIEPPETGD